MVATLASCEKDNDKPKMYNGPLCINGATPTLKATGYDPSNPLEGFYKAKEIVKRAAFIQVERLDGNGLITLNVTDAFKDTVKVRLMIPAEHVLKPDLTITDFCYCKNMLILDSKKDTMACLKNFDYGMFRTYMEEKMAIKDFSSLDALFQATMYFHPMNGKRYKEIKESGEDVYKHLQGKEGLHHR